MVNGLLCADTRALTLTVRGNDCHNDSCSSLHNNYGAILPNTSKSSLLTDVLFVCSKMSPLCGIKDALHLLLPISYVTSLYCRNCGKATVVT